MANHIGLAPTSPADAARKMAQQCQVLPAIPLAFLFRGALVAAYLGTGGEHGYGQRPSNGAFGSGLVWLVGPTGAAVGTGGWLPAGGATVGAVAGCAGGW